MILKLLKPRRATQAQRSIARVAAGERIYAIGDIHGRHDLLTVLYRRIRRDAAWRRDDRRLRILLLGDYIDRGDDSARVLEALRAISAEDPDHVLCLLGNHEAALLGFLEDPVAGQAWLDFGAAQTLASFGVPFPGRNPDHSALYRVRDALDAALGDHVNFLRKLPTHYRSGDVLFTHAGLNPDDADQLRDTKAMLWGHPEFLTPEPVPGLRVVHGHYDAAVPEVLPGRICVDTGAYYSGVLTAVRLDAEEGLISVDASRDL